MKYYCAKPSGIMLTQLVDNLATKHAHTHTLYTPDATTIRYIYDVKGINIQL